MGKIRRALVFSSTERYINLIVNFVLIAVTSRLLTPAEIGVSALGTTIWIVGEVVRDVPSIYLVQQKEINRIDVRTAFAAMLLVSAVLTTALFAASGWIAEIYDDPKLATYWQLLAIAFLLGPIERPILALFKREMAFDKVALISIPTMLVHVIVTIALVLFGFSYLSFAWGTLAGSLVAMILAVYLRPEFWMFKPLLTHWRRAIRYGGYASAAMLCSRAFDLLPYLLLSRLFQFDAVGLYNRALLISQLPDRLVLSWLEPVVFPGLAEKIRSGHNIKQPYLMAISYITAIIWPGYLGVALLAHPIIKVLLGEQWLGIVPLVQIIAVALLSTFPIMLTNQTLLALGALRHMLLANIVGRSVSAVFVAFAAFYGLTAIAVSLLLALPFTSLVFLWFLHHHVPFNWREIAAAVAKSAVLSGCCALGPIIVIVATGFQFDLSIPAALAAAILFALGWVIGVRISQHPIQNEFGVVLEALEANARTRRITRSCLQILDPLDAFLTKLTSRIGRSQGK